MTELIDARKKRQEILKGIILDLHAGRDLAELKTRFATLLKNVSASEISEMENNLIAEGMPPEEVRRLCDVHVEVFKEGLQPQESPGRLPGHPVQTFRQENEAIRQVAGSLQALFGQIDGNQVATDDRQKISTQLDLLAEINKHYLRKENQLFPVLERRGIYGPPKVMWQIHEDIRSMLRDVKKALETGDAQLLRERGEKLVAAISDMIFKEENILFPMALQSLNEADWVRVRSGEEEIGYTLVTPGNEWRPVAEQDKVTGPTAPDTVQGIRLATGELTPEQINLILTNLPVDITFVDEHGQVRYYSQGEQRIFPRSPGIIGRQVQNCHPADSVHVVNKILEEFQQGTKDQAEFWLEMNGRFVYIRYFAMRAEDGGFRGVMEVSQDITQIKSLTGEKRLLDW